MNLSGARTTAVEKILQGSQGENVSLVAIMDFADTCEHSQVSTEFTIIAPTLALCEAIQQLRRTLSQALPPYMVLSFYVPVAKMPLNI